MIHLEIHLEKLEIQLQGQTIGLFHVLGNKENFPVFNSLS